MTNNEYITLTEEYKQYKKVFDRYNIRIDSIISFCESGGKIIQIHEYYEKSPTARNFPKKPKTIETEETSGKHYLNHMTWINTWLGVKVTGKSYTYCGYIPNRVTSVRPDGCAKSVTMFKFVKEA